MSIETRRLDRSDEPQIGTVENRYEFGHRLMGPVIAEYLSKLHEMMTFFGRRHGARPLFVARSGIRIRRALEVYATAVGRKMPQNAENFWVSRIMAAKGTWRRNRNGALDTFVAEFENGSIRDFVQALLYDEKRYENFPIMRRSLDRPIQDLERFFDRKGLIARRLLSYLDEQSRLFEMQIDRLLDGHKRALLIDSGWAGTIQRLLSDAYPDIDWWGAYFGRYGFPDTDRRYWRKMFGLVFERESYEFHKPETCVVLHRHMIEHLFQPSGKSVERLIGDEGGAVVAPEAEGNLADNPQKETAPIYCGVLDYLSALSGDDSPAGLHRAARKAWWEISRIVALPTKAKTELFSDMRRSADFGKTLEVEVLLPPRARRESDTPEQRIQESLWQPGQIALEYPPEIAEPLQRKSLGLSPLDFGQPVEKPVGRPVVSGVGPTVAVITRTLDRPMFLRRALASVADQTFTDYLHVVVNDGGDNAQTKSVIETSDCLRHKVVLVDAAVNRGMEAASNIGIAAVDSEYIVIHDDDDTWEPEFLAKTTSFLNGTGGRKYGGVITHSNYVSEEITAEGINICGRDDYQGWVRNVHIMEMAAKNFFPPIAFVFRRDVHDRIGGFNEDYPVLGDWDFNLRFLLESDIGVIPEAMANYHHRDGGHTDLFGNSVIKDRDKHMEYSAIIRNRFTRNALQANHPVLSVLVGLGMHFDENRSNIRELKGNVPIDRDPHNADDLWVAMGGLPPPRKGGSVIGTIVNGAVSAMGMLSTNRRRAASWGGLSSDDVSHLKNLRNKAGARRPPPDFDEKRYLGDNPDVAAAVRGGEFSSGFEHYYRHGRREGRGRPMRNADGG